uniref:Uncharacterized protein n=1 Tax=Cacopsylla melanoneura TaxID=428564 RepID=A0A8D8R430_9HEMI
MILFLCYSSPAVIHITILTATLITSVYLHAMSLNQRPHLLCHSTRMALPRLLTLTQLTISPMKISTVSIEPEVYIDSYQQGQQEIYQATWSPVEIQYLVKIYKLYQEKS